MLNVELSNIWSCVSLPDLLSREKELFDAHLHLRSNQPGFAQYLGWLGQSDALTARMLHAVRTAEKAIRAAGDTLVVLGTASACRAAQAALALLGDRGKGRMRVFFAGDSLSSRSWLELCDRLEGHDFCLHIVSPLGGEMETAIASRAVRWMMERRYGKEAAGRIYCTTDRARGTLKSLADREGWQTFVIPDDVGGRYSVLTAVGLLPMAVAGIDIDAVLAGAEKAMNELDNDDFFHNPCYRYAALRNILLRRGKAIEIYASYEPRFTQMGEWLKQLYGESEGKDGKGLFPASVAFTTDLHSMGQFIQDGSRNLFETVIDFITPAADLTVEEDPENLDGLNFLSGMAMRQINRRAMQGTILAHTRGGVPNLVLEIPAINEEEYGYMVYFFMLACGISGYLLGVNPFDQPGVEAYKKNMFALLGKPGYEDLRQELLAKLGE